MTDCCPPNSFPALKIINQTTSGTIVTHKSATFYSTGSLNDNTERRAVVFMPDGMGWDSGRTRKVADYIGSHLNVLTVVLKSLTPYKSGEDGLPSDYDFANATDTAERTAWLKSVSWELVVQGRVTDLFEYLDTHKCTGVGLVGFCWGGWASTQVAAHFESRVKCQAIAHPSIVNVESLFTGDYVALCKRVKCPTFLLPAGNDLDAYRSGGDVFTAFKENNAASKSSEHDFDSMKHGWVVRSDNEADYPLVTKAVDQIVGFLREHLLI